MVRSLYSGVSGMMAQQTKMDVIGNNISNVGTYGYKSSRATFQDVYYQTKNTATAASSTTGGTNATQIGYGSKLASIDVNTSQSIMTSTGYAMDCAITGEGYFQVMDNDGNIFYTKAGMFDIDANGNLVDINGNFVLGTKGYPNSIISSSTPGSDKISISLPYEDASYSSAEATINGIGIKIASTNEDTAGNLTMTFASTTSLPVGQKASATVTSSSIVIKLNANESFANLAELQKSVNDAITKANGGQQHAAGEFRITMDDETPFANGLTGSEIVGQNFGVNLGSVVLPEPFSNYCSVKSVGDGFTGDTVNADVDFTFDTNNNLTITIGDYVGTISAKQVETSSGTIMMKKNGSETDSFTMSYPSYSIIKANKLDSLTNTPSATMQPTRQSNDIGLGSTPFNLTGGTQGGEQTVANLTGISIGVNGVITGIHPSQGIIELGRIDLATFQNPAGLTQEGDTYFAVSPNSGEPVLSVPGENGTGAISSSTLESSNVDLSQEFSDMIITQRAFQACSRVITVTDTMLEELINLKR